MCELLAMSSRRPSRLTFSLETLAAHSRPPGRQRDGWGAAFYRDNDVALFREPTAASDSPLVQFLETQGPSTTLAISHIRHATRGAVALANTQPFARELGGRMHVFAHGDRRLQAATGKAEPPGLHLLSRRCDDEGESVHGRGLSVAPGFREVLLIASVPLTEEKWRPFAHGEVVAASAGRVLVAGARDA